MSDVNVFWNRYFPAPIFFPDILRQALQSIVPQFLRHPVKSFGNAAGDAGDGSIFFKAAYLSSKIFKKLFEVP